MKGKKPKIRNYKPSELKKVKVPNPMEIKNPRQIKFAHTLLHWAWNGRALKDWTPIQVIAEHYRVVSVMLKEGIEHKIKDTLDKTLPKTSRKS
ncbi:MAG: hypothetical protein AB1765_07110 [Candidatus Hydrogenedentota bacterium]